MHVFAFSVWLAGVYIFCHRALVCVCLSLCLQRTLEQVSSAATRVECARPLKDHVPASHHTLRSLSKRSQVQINVDSSLAPKRCRWSRAVCHRFIYWNRYLHSTHSHILHRHTERAHRLPFTVSASLTWSSMSFPHPLLRIHTTCPCRLQRYAVDAASARRWLHAKCASAVSKVPYNIYHLPTPYTISCACSFCRCFLCVGVFVCLRVCILLLFYTVTIFHTLTSPCHPLLSGSWGWCVGDHQKHMCIVSHIVGDINVRRGAYKLGGLADWLIVCVFTSQVSSLPLSQSCHVFYEKVNSTLYHYCNVIVPWRHRESCVRVWVQWAHCASPCVASLVFLLFLLLDFCVWVRMEKIGFGFRQNLQLSSGYLQKIVYLYVIVPYRCT